MNRHSKPQKWRRFLSRVVFTHPRIVLAEDEVELPDGKRSLYLRQVYQGKGGVIIICQNGDKVLIQREYSYPVDDILYQFPGVKLKKVRLPSKLPSANWRKNLIFWRKIFSKLAGFMPTIAVLVPSCTLSVRAALFEIIIRSNRMKQSLFPVVG